MPRMLHRSCGAKVFLATPAYSGLGAGYTFALFSSSAALSQAGITAELAIFSGDCHIDDARNRLVRDFLETDCTDLVFLDSDLRWEPEDLVKLCQYDRDVVGATYPLKQDEEKYPVQMIGGEIWADKDGLIEVDGLPTGFLRIRRHVLQTLADASVKFRPKSDSRSALPLIFERTIHDGARWGGDYTFCRKWREAGGRIHVAPEVWLEHDVNWKGSLGSWLRRHNGLSFKHGLKAIADRTETPETYRELIQAWDNPWCAASDLLAVATELARRADGPILECGSGLTSLAMAAATDQEVHSLEHDAGWQAKVAQEARRAGLTNLTVYYFPLRDGWYAYRPGRNYSLVLCDGPPRDKSDRAGLFERDDFIQGPLIMDDVDDPRYLAMLTEWAESRDRKVTVFGEHRKFAIAA